MYASTELFVFDLDGTIADITHRLHFITPPKESIERILALCNRVRDEALEEAAKLCESKCPHNIDFKGVLCRDHETANQIRALRSKGRKL